MPSNYFVGAGQDIAVAHRLVVGDDGLVRVAPDGHGNPEGPRETWPGEQPDEAVFAVTSVRNAGGDAEALVRTMSAGEIRARDAEQVERKRAAEEATRLQRERDEAAEKFDREFMSDLEEVLRAP